MYENWTMRCTHAYRKDTKKLTDYVYPQLREDPFLGPNIKKLKGYDPATWRYRIGKFRVFFMVNQAERIIFMLSVDDRRVAYR
jgi:mRNA interferase RelE/StbE